MSDFLPLVIAALGLFGGAALGVAVGGGAASAAKMRGAPVRVAIVLLAVLGGGIGLVVVGGAKPADAVDMVIRASRPSDEARLLAVLKAHYPDDYARAKSTLDGLHAANATPAQIDQALDRLTLPLVTRQMPLADIDTAHAMLVVSRDQARDLAKDPQLCYRALTQPTADTMQALDAAQSRDLKRRSTDLTIELLDQSATRPESSEGSIDVEGDTRMWLRDAVLSLTPREQALLQSPHGATPSDEQAAVWCHAYSRLLQRMSEADDESAAEVYKAMASQGLDKVRL